MTTPLKILLYKTKALYYSQTLVLFCQTTIIVNDWELMELMISNISDKLGAKSEKNSALIVEPAVHNKDFRLNFVELFFEKFNSPSVFFHKAPLLSLYAFARENALVLDVGAESTYCTPIQDGFILDKGKSFLYDT